MAKLTEDVNEVLIFVRGDQGKNVRMLADPRMCCKCLQVRKISRIYREANSCSHHLALLMQCMSDLLQPEHRLWSTQRELVQPLARQQIPCSGVVDFAKSSSSVTIDDRPT